MKARLRALDPDEVAALAEPVAATVRSLPEFGSAECVGLYAAMPEELPTRGVFDAARGEGMRCAFPRCEPGGTLAFAFVEDWENLRLGRYGLLEPVVGEVVVSVSELGLLLVPGLAFDAAGGRLGRGGGYYDRTLAGMESEARRPAIFGMAHDWQQVEHVPRGPLDRCVDGIVTDRSVTRCQAAGRPGEAEK